MVGVTIVLISSIFYCAVEVHGTRGMILLKKMNKNGLEWMWFTYWQAYVKIIGYMCTTSVDVFTDF